MSTLAGIDTQKNNKGEITHVTIDVKKHSVFVKPLLEKIKIVEKSKFEKDCEGAITIEEARKRSLAYIEKIWKK